MGNASSTRCHFSSSTGLGKLFLLLENCTDDDASMLEQLHSTAKWTAWHERNHELMERHIRTSFHDYRKSCIFALTEGESGPLLEEYARLSIEFQRRIGLVVAENRFRTRLAQCSTGTGARQAYSLESPLHIRRRLGLGRYNNRDTTKIEAAHVHANVVVGASEAAVPAPNTRRASRATWQRLQDEMADEVREVTRLADARLDEYERDMPERNRQAFVTLQRPWDHSERKGALLYLSELTETLTPATPRWRDFNAALGLLEGAEQAMQCSMSRAIYAMPETAAADLGVGRAQLGVARCRADVHVPLAPCNSLVEGRAEASSGTDVLTAMTAKLHEADARTAAAAPAG